MTRPVVWKKAPKYPRKWAKRADFEALKRQYIDHETMQTEQLADISSRLQDLYLKWADLSTQIAYLPPEWRFPHTRPARSRWERFVDFLR
jgi:hypothetical protein